MSSSKPRRRRRELPDHPAPPAKHGRNTGDRDKRGRFIKGNRASHGNSGQHRTGRLRRALDRAVSDQDLAEVLASILQRAKGGDSRAARLLLERLGGKPRVEPEETTPLSLKLPRLTDLEACAQAQQSVLQATTTGVLSLNDAERLARLVEQVGDRLVAVQLEQRIIELEALHRDQ